MKLGMHFDYVPAIFPQDVDGGVEGFLARMTNYGGMSIVGFFGAAGGTVRLRLREHNLFEPISQDLPVVTRYYFKGGSTLEPDTPWSEATQDVAATWGDFEWGGAGNKVFFETSVESEALSDGFEWLSADIDDPGGPTTACMFYSLYDLKIQRTPTKLPNTLS